MDPWEALADHQGAPQAWEVRPSWEGLRLLVASQADLREGLADLQGHPWADQVGCHHLRGGKEPGLAGDGADRGRVDHTFWGRWEWRVFL